MADDFLFVLFAQIERCEVFTVFFDIQRHDYPFHVGIELLVRGVNEPEICDHKSITNALKVYCSVGIVFVSRTIFFARETERWPCQKRNGIQGYGIFCKYRKLPQK